MTEQRPVCADGSPLPWFTYGAIEFLERITRDTDRVFEYGAGYSSLWWQERVKFVVSVEHDLEWVAQLKSQIGANVQLKHISRFAPFASDCDEIIANYRKRMRRTQWPEYDMPKVIRRGLVDDGFERYASTIMEHEGLFDVIVVDGMARRLCCAFAIQKLTHEGIIILDNSNRRDYDTAYDLLEEAGFRQIPFWGLVPGASFFYLYINFHSIFN
jgi:hypothetical protein